MRLWLSLVVFFSQTMIITASPWAAAALSLPEAVIPGALVIGGTAPGCTVRMDGRSLRVSDEGHFILGAGRDAKGTIKVVVECPNSPVITHSIKVADRSYDIQRIDGLPSRKVSPSKKDQERIASDYAILTDAKLVDSDERGFAELPVWPATGRISGVFGSQRILNGKPRSPHRGVDVAAPEGQPVNAMLDGVVTVAAENMYYTGGTVMVDHGHGLQSIYAHLSEISVETGQRLSKGDKLGEIGATGRATGPHLHLGLYWFDTALDPALLLGPIPKKIN